MRVVQLAPPGSETSIIIGEGITDATPGSLQDVQLIVSDLRPLLEIPGCGVITAARLLAEIAGVQRFQTDAQLALYAGVAPLEASSGKTRRYRLNRRGNRRLNSALYVIVLTQARIHPPAREYLARRRAQGKSTTEAIRALKRHLIRRIFRGRHDRSGSRHRSRAARPARPPR